MPDDFSADIHTTGVLQNGVASNAVFETTKDVDWFKFHAEAGQLIRFYPGGADIFPDNLSRSIYTSDGSWLKFVNDYPFVASRSGDYFLSVSAAGRSGAYSQTMQVSSDDYANDLATATVSLAPRTEVKGVLDYTADSDIFQLNMVAGHTYTVTLAAANGDTNGISLALYRPGQVAGYIPSGTESRTGKTTFSYQADESGRYGVGVSSSFRTGAYTLWSFSDENDDVGNDAAHAGAIPASTPIKASLETASDHDVFKISAVSGMSYLVELKPDQYQSSLGFTVSDAAQRSLPLLGQPNTGPGDYANDTRAFVADKAGDYYVDVSGRGISGYTLTVSPAGMDDYAANSSTTGFLAPGQPVHGTLNVVGDKDWIKVHLDAGQRYTFELQGARTGGGSLETTYTEMYLLRADGGGLATSSIPGASVGVDPRLSYTAPSSGDYFLDIHGQFGPPRVGSYTLSEVQNSLDKTAPVLLSSSLAANTSEVSLRAPKIVLSFNEIVVPDQDITLTDSNGVKVPSFGISQLSVAGKVVTFDTQSNLRPGMTYTLNLPNGGVHDLAGNSANLQSFSFTAVKPVTLSTAGNDYLIGSSAGLALQGGAGVDSVWYAGSSANYQILRNADGRIQVRDTTTVNARADVLSGIEHLVFANQTLGVDIDGVGAQAYRMYKGALNRAPDAEGLGYWIYQMEKGLPLHDVANSFIVSAEFNRAYGSNLSDASFVTQLYKNVLGREPDQAGQNYWLGAMENGASRADVLASFSESPENYSAVAKLIGNGFAYTPYG